MKWDLCSLSLPVREVAYPVELGKVEEMIADCKKQSVDLSEMSYI